MQERLFLHPRQLCLGLHVHLDLGWMSHPFPLNSFRIANEQQLETLRGLGLARVEVLVQRSETVALQALVEAGVVEPEAVLSAEAAAATRTDKLASSSTPGPAAPESAAAADLRRRREALAAELACIAQAERHYGEATRSLRLSFEQAIGQPQAARSQCESQVNGLLDKLLDAQDMAIRLLSEGAGDRASTHAVNVAVLSLLLGRQLGLDKTEMFDLGVGSMLHDVGKLELPDRARWLDPAAPGVSSHDRQLYQQHVSQGVAIGRKMGLSDGALLVIAQHHELADGSGFPLRLAADRIAGPARIVALVNRYDKLVNPLNPSSALTPHEALALMYAQMKPRFDAAVFGAFIKMMGVYPPGSVVQLSDDRYAMVVTVNASRPLKPSVLIHDPRHPREEAVALDLQTTPGLSIRRSLKPLHLPRATLDYLSPRLRVCYFFERAREPFGLAEEKVA